jgi:tight adherence protein C
MGLCGAALGWVVPSFLLSIKLSKRQLAIQKLLPDAVDLLVICVEAGMGLNQALQRVAEELRHAGATLTEEIAQMNLEIRAGAPREQALLGLADRTGVADVRSLVIMLIQTERFGTSIADSLRVHAETMRVARQQRAEEAAAKTTIKLVLPLALCILPALLVVIIGPVAIQVVEALRNVGG